MAETTGSLEKTMNNSVGGPCDFPEEINLPTDASTMKVTKKVRGDQGERRRFKKDLQAMVDSGLLKADQLEKWAQIG